VTRVRLAEIGVHTIGQLAEMPGYSLERLLGRAAGEKLTALAWNRDPRQIRTGHRAQSAGAQSALGKKPAEEQVFRPTLRHLADRVASRLRAVEQPLANHFRFSFGPGPRIARGRRPLHCGNSIPSMPWVNRVGDHRDNTAAHVRTAPKADIAWVHSRRQLLANAAIAPSRVGS
jgi:nucleotidyltransferase/DNA polymerase involved in DNA repair